MLLATRRPVVMNSTAVVGRACILCMSARGPVHRPEVLLGHALQLTTMEPVVVRDACVSVAQRFRTVKCACIEPVQSPLQSSCVQ